MRTDSGDLLIDDLTFGPLEYKSYDYFREGIGVLPNQRSPWLLREFFNPHDFHIDRIYHDFFRLFSPDHVFERRSIYEIREGKKAFLGCAINSAQTSGVQILNTCDVHVLFDQGIVEAVSVLFFLNQSCSLLENFFIDMVDCYKIIRFDSMVPDSPLTEIHYHSSLTDGDRNNKLASQFLSKLSGYISSDSKEFPVFFKKRELTLLNIVIAPDFDELFDFSGCDNLKENLSLRKKQLREILLASDRFSEIIFQLTPGELQNNINDFFYCLKKYDEKNFARHRDAVIKNYMQFFCDFLKIRFEQVASELQREVSSVVFHGRDADTQRIYNALMIKGALNQLYFIPNETGFFSQLILNCFPTCLSMLHVFNAIVLNFDNNDLHRKQIISLRKVMDDVANSHEFLRSFISAICKPDFDLTELPDEINLDEVVQYTQDWLSKTDMVGLETVLINKNSVLLMFDRALWYASDAMRAPHAPCSTVFLQSAMKLREQATSFKTANEIKAFIYKLIQLSDETFLTFFFRQLILHCYFEMNLVMFSQYVILIKDFDEKIVHDKIRSLLLKSITNCQVKEFWNKVLFMYEAAAQEAGWCRIDIQPVSDAHFSVSHSSFFGSGNVGRVVVSSKENLFSTTTAVVESDSAKMMVDSLKSIAGSTSNTVAAAATSAKAAISSATELISAWWNRR